MTDHFAAFVGIAVVLIVTPGPDTALTIRNTFVCGRRGGLATGVGVASGQATWAVLTAAGVAAVLRASQPVFQAIRIGGVCYLVYLGLSAFFAAVRSGDEAGDKSIIRPRPRSALPSYWQGLLSNLSNPKMVVFFISLLPQFDPHGSFAALLALGLVFAALTLSWLTAYAIVVARAGDILNRARVRQVLEGLTGVALIGVGVRLALERD